MLRKYLLSVVVFVAACSGDVNERSNATTLGSGAGDGGGPSGGAPGGAQSGGSPGGSPGGCADEQTLCNEGCVDAGVDARHCGGCEKTCDPVQYCLDGECRASAIAACVDVVIGAVTGDPAFSGSTSGLASRRDGLCRRSGKNPDQLLGWVAPESGRYRFHAAGQGWDPVMSAESVLPVGQCATSELACDDDGGGPDAAAFSLDAFRGQEVLVAVDAFRTSGSGPYQLSITLERSETEPDGACENPGDMAWVGQGMTLSVAHHCATGVCAGSATPDGCVADCLREQIPMSLTDGCLGCHADYALCVTELCGEVCAQHPDQEPCWSCDASTCAGPFHDCSGVR